jgi:putative tryptophan/tyrosine transport system substrate-binding protein
MVGLKKIIQISSVCLVIVLGLVGCKKSEVATIGMTQIVEHEALSSAREGFIDGLASRGFKEGENVKFIYQNAQGDTNNANLIAQTFVSKQVDLILAIATNSAQAAKNATEGTDIPVLFSAVTDPVKSELVLSNENPGGNVTGTSDMTPFGQQFALVKTLFGSNQKIGIIYNTNEPNSKIQVDLMKEFAKVDGHTLVIKGVTTTSELQDALIVMLNEVDLIMNPTDNLVASSMPLMTSLTLEAKVPMVGSEEAQVKAGALITEGIDYYNLGFQTGLMAADILEGKSPQDIPVEILRETSLVINKTTQEALGIQIPESLLSRAIFVESGDKDD